MADKGGKKDKDKHNKQVNAAKNAQDEANRKKQEKPHQQKKGRGLYRPLKTRPRWFIERNPYEGNDNWIEETIGRIHACLVGDGAPQGTDGCKYCDYIDKAVVLVAK